MKIDSQNIGFRITPENLSRFRQGQRVSGKVIAFFKGKPVIKFGSSPPMVTFSSVKLEIGQTVDASVTKIEHNRVFMKLEPVIEKSPTISSNKIKNLLQELKLENTTENTGLVKNLALMKFPLNDMEKIISFKDSSKIPLDKNILLALSRINKFGMSLSIRNLVKAISQNTSEIHKFLGKLAFIPNQTEGNLEAEDIKLMLKILDIKNFISSTGDGEINQETILHASSEKLIEHSDSDFFYYDLPFFINSETDNIRVIYKRNKKKSNTGNKINSFMISLKLNKLGKIVFHVWQKKKSISISAYTDNRLSNTLINMFFPKLSKRLTEKGYNIVKQQSFLRESILDPVDKTLDEKINGKVDFRI